MVVRRCSVPFACSVNGMVHSRLPLIEEGNVYRNTYQACYSIEFDGMCYGVAIWTSPVALNRMSEKRSLELRRMALTDDAPRNTATRFLSIMIKDIRASFPDIVLLISYQDTSVHSGTIYKAGNWTPACVSNNYDWGVTRNRKVAQAPSSKVRWEYRLKV